jgi:hypothetical protein
VVRERAAAAAANNMMFLIVFFCVGCVETGRWRGDDVFRSVASSFVSCACLRCPPVSPSLRCLTSAFVPRSACVELVAAVFSDNGI